VPELSRRDLLKMAAVGLGAVAVDGIVAACKSVTAPLTSGLPAASPSPTATWTPDPSPSASATPSASPTSSASAGYPDLVVVRNGEPEALVRRAIAALGGMERFVRPGAKVIVKPNMCVAYRTYEYAATTNPWVVGTLVKMAFESGASTVRVMDYPYGGAAADAYVKSGIQDQVQAAGGEMVLMSARKYVSTKIPSGKWLKQADFYDEFLNTDVLINAPIAKVHAAARMTGAMKNLMGTIRDRPALHGNLGQAIADVSTVIKPQLTVVDAVRILTAHGPSGGSLSYVKKLDTVIAGVDVVAADAYTATLLGFKPTDIAYINAGAAMGLGQADLSSLRIEELTA
jgi:uncharacterized protein (DUF362 family)